MSNNNVKDWSEFNKLVSHVLKKHPLHLSCIANGIKLCNACLKFLQGCTQGYAQGYEGGGYIKVFKFSDLHCMLKLCLVDSLE